MVTGTPRVTPSRIADPVTAPFTVKTEVSEPPRVTVPFLIVAASLTLHDPVEVDPIVKGVELLFKSRVPVKFTVPPLRLQLAADVSTIKVPPRLTVPPLTVILPLSLHVPPILAVPLTVKAAPD